MAESATPNSAVNSFFAWSNYGQTMTWAAVVFAVDGLGSGMYAFAPWVLIANLLFRLPSHLFRWRFRQRTGSLLVAKRCATLILASVLTIAYCNILQRIAVHRASAVSHALEQYRIKNGIYPESLNALMPDYLNNIPSLKPVFSPPNFTYRLTSTGPMLMFGPGPWPRPTMYNFESGKWTLYD